MEQFNKSCQERSNRQCRKRSVHDLNSFSNESAMKPRNSNLNHRKNEKRDNLYNLHSNSFHEPPSKKQRSMNHSQSQQQFNLFTNSNMNNNRFSTNPQPQNHFNFSSESESRNNEIRINNNNYKPTHYRSSQSMQEIISKIKEIEVFYNEEREFIFDTKEDILLKIKEFLSQNICSKSCLFSEIGITSCEYNTFFSKPRLNRVHIKCYHWFEKLRIAFNQKKSMKRLQNEQKYGNRGIISNNIEWKNKDYDNTNRAKELYNLYGDKCGNCGERGHWKGQCKKNEAHNKCNRCGEYGHFMKNCGKWSMKPKKEYLFDKYGSNCFKCGQNGHWARDCTNNNNNKY